MRVSSNQDDPGYVVWRNIRSSGKNVRVYLNGIEQAYCTMADSDEGIVIRLVPDSEGELQIDPDNPSEVLAETVAGKVEVLIE